MTVYIELERYLYIYDISHFTTYNSGYRFEYQDND